MAAGIRWPGVTWPRVLLCHYCGEANTIRSAAEEQAWWRQHGRCLPAPVLEAIDAAWGISVHGGGHDPTP